MTTAPTAAMPAAGPVLHLGAEMTIAHAAAHRDSLVDALAAAPGGLQLDLSGVSDVDSSGVQLLLAARRSLAERGQPLQIVAASAAVQDALQLFGLAELLATPARA